VKVKRKNTVQDARFFIAFITLKTNSEGRTNREKKLKE